MLSGDNDGEKENLLKIFKNESQLHFKQSPQDKLNFVKQLQSEKKKVLMIGDGLNDAGALSQSDVGISVTEDISNFTPACDAILDSRQLKNFIKYLKFSKSSLKIIYLNFLISFIYNISRIKFCYSRIAITINCCSAYACKFNLCGFSCNIINKFFC